MPDILPVEVVGVSHVAGKYNFTEADYLNEGADALHELGCAIIKVWFTGNPQAKYPFNSQWPDIKSLVDLAKTEYFKNLFSQPIGTFVLETYAPGREEHYYLAGMSAQQIEREKNDIRDAAAYLLQTYKGSGKTFVMQNWEGDWSLRGGAPGNDPKPQAVQGMIDWLNARQAGVEEARQQNKVDAVRVLHAAEVNHVARAMKNEGITVTNDVLPHTKCDLYSYSAYDVPTHEPDKFKAALDYLAQKSPGENNIYVGEYGAPENDVGGPEVQDKRIRAATQTALDWRARYAIYWQLYCNELKPDSKDLKTRPQNKDMRGFWLIRPDGSRPPVTDYFIDLWNRR